MRILYDGEIYSIFRHGGVIRYFYHLISGLGPDDQPLLLGNHEPEIPPPHPNLRLHVKSYDWMNPRLKPLRKWLDRRYCRRQWPAIQPDLIHPTYYNEVARGRYAGRRVPLVLTIYDMIHERFADQVDRRGAHSQRKRLAVQQADHLLCISDTTRRDLIERFQVPEEKTSVTLLAVDDVFHEPVQQGEAESDRDVTPFFLFVGRRDLYKNFSGLLEALRRLRATASEGELPFQLRVVGSPFTSAEQETIATFGLQDTISRYPFADDVALGRLYRQSIGLVFPSLWEGFGLPLLEALAAGTCVVASDIPVFRELVQQGFEPFDPHCPDSIGQALLRMALDPASRQRRIEIGRGQLSRFTWQNTVHQTREIYQTLLS